MTRISRNVALLLPLASLLVHPGSAVRQSSRPSTHHFPSALGRRAAGRSFSQAGLGAAIAVAHLHPFRVLADDNDGAAGDAAQSLPPPPPAMTVSYLGEDIPFRKFMGRATLVVNIKLDDPQAGPDMTALEGLALRLGPQGLRIVAVPTDQGWFEPDTSDVIRQKANYAYKYGATVDALVLDKMNVEPPGQHPLYDYLVNALPTPAGGRRIGLNFEKFLLDSSGRPLRRYPRKFSVASLAPDVEAVLAVEGDVPSADAQACALPPVSTEWAQSWEAASSEARRSEYAFRPSGINRSYYTGYGMDMKAEPSDLKPK